MSLPPTAHCRYPADLSWADGSKVAVWPVLNVEHFLPGRPGPAIQPHLGGPYDIANRSWREYGNRVGVFRVFDLFAEIGTPLTVALNGAVCDADHRIVEAIVQNGWDVIGHGWENSTPHHEMTRDGEHEVVARTLTTIAKATGRAVRGWLTPGFAVSGSTFDILAELGVEYTADLALDDRPFWFPAAPGELLSVPYSLETNDISLLLSLRHTPEQFAGALVAHVAALSMRSAGNAVVALGLHPFLIGQPGRLPWLRSALQRLAAMPQVWLTTGGAIADRVTSPNVR